MAPIVTSSLSMNTLFFSSAGIRILPCLSISHSSALANTSTVTNIGNIPIEEPYRPYVEMILAYLAMSKGQDIKGTVCSYGDTLAFSFSYTLKDVSIQRCFFRKLAADGIEVEIDSNGVNYE